MAKLTLRTKIKLGLGIFVFVGLVGVFTYAIFTGRISGFAATLSGKVKIAGTIRITSSDCGSDKSKYNAYLYHYPEGNFKSARINSSGYYEFSGLADGSYEVNVIGPCAYNDRRDCSIDGYAKTGYLKGPTTKTLQHSILPNRSPVRVGVTYKTGGLGYGITVKWTDVENKSGQAITPTSGDATYVNIGSHRPGNFRVDLYKSTKYLGYKNFTVKACVTQNNFGVQI